MVACVLWGHGSQLSGTNVTSWRVSPCRPLVMSITVRFCLQRWNLCLPTLLSFQRQAPFFFGHKFNPGPWVLSDEGENTMCFFHRMGSYTAWLGQPLNDNYYSIWRALSHFSIRLIGIWLNLDELLQVELRRSRSYWSTCLWRDLAKTNYDFLNIVQMKYFLGFQLYYHPPPHPTHT